MTTSNHSPDCTLLPGDVEGGAKREHGKVRDYRKLAICSIICGLSCAGIMSLIYSVKTREANKKYNDETKARQYSKKTLSWAIGAIVAWVICIIVFVLLLGLLSFLLTFID